MRESRRNAAAAAAQRAWRRWRKTRVMQPPPTAATVPLAPILHKPPNSNPPPPPAAKPQGRQFVPDGRSSFNAGGRPRPQPITGTPPPPATQSASSDIMQTERCDFKVIQQTCALFGLDLERLLLLSVSRDTFCVNIYSLLRNVLHRSLPAVPTRLRAIGRSPSLKPES